MTANSLAQIRASLARPVDASSLAVARIVFGLVMVAEAIHLWPLADVLSQTRIRFGYPFLFGYGGPMPGSGNHVVFLVLALAAAGVAAGFYTRVCSALVCVTFTYVWLLDVSFYNNHYYLFSILALWFAVIGSGRTWSIDRFVGKKPPETVPRWHIEALRLQLCIAYFYGGIAKLNADWFQGEPGGYFLSEAAVKHAWAQSFLSSTTAEFCVIYGGVLIDLLGPILLLVRPTRVYAILVLTVFHLANGLILFDNIGMFPWMMIGLAVLFLEPGTPGRVLAGVRARCGHEAPAVTDDSSAHSGPLTTGTVCALTVYFTIQLLLPFRHYLIAGNVRWTAEHSRFSWYMKGSRKQSYVRVVHVYPDGRMTEVEPERFLSEVQLADMATRPRLIASFVQQYLEQLPAEDRTQAKIICSAVGGMNGRKAQFVVDPSVDLTTVDFPLWQHAEWIVPLNDGPVRYYQSVMEWHADVQQLLTENGRVYSGLAHDLIRAGHIEAARVEWERLATVEPRNSTNWLRLGDCLRRLNHPQAALNCYARSVQLNPDVSEARNNLGVMLSRTSPQEAISHLKAAVELEPRNAQAHNSLANALVRAGDPATGIRHYEAALEIDPGFDACRRNFESVSQLLASAQRSP